MNQQTLSPLVAPYMKRSEYLAKALEDLHAGSVAPRSKGELFTRLLAEGVLQHNQRSNDKDLAGAQAKQRQTQAAAALEGLGIGPKIQAPQAPAAPAPSAPPPGAPPQAPDMAPYRPGQIQTSQLPPAGPASEGFAPGHGLDALAAALEGDIKARGPQPFASLDEAKAKIGGVAPGVQFTSGLRSKEQNARLPGAVANSDHLTGQALDMVPPQGMDMRQLAQQLGGAGLPGEILPEKDHVHMEWGNGWKRPQPPMPQPVLQQAAQPAPQMPPQMAQGGAPAPPQQMQAPPQPQQAPAPPQMPQQAQQAPQGQQQAFGQPLGPTPQEAAFLQHALNDPELFEQGMALAQKIQARMMEPRKFETSNINGVPTWADPYNPGSMQTGAVPQAAMNQTRSAQSIGIPAPAGTTMSVDPTGKPSQVYAPPTGYQNGDQGRMQAIQGGPADQKSGGNLVSNEAALRKEYDTSMKEYNEARSAYQKVVAAAKDGTGASDIALIFGFMKTLDPGSTVREGEFATAQNSGSIDQTIMNMYNRVLKGERLQPEQRGQFANTAANQFGVYQQRADQLNQRFKQLSESYGYDPSRIVQQQPQVERFTPGAAPASPAPQAPQRPARPGVQQLPGGVTIELIK